jgi:ABC-type lipoprotein release transport system permease subunit
MTVLAVSIAVAMVIGVSITFESMTLQYQKTLATAAGGVDIVVRSSSEFGKMDEAVIGDVREVDGVAAAAGRVTVETKVHTERKTRYAWVTGVSEDDFAYNDPSFTNVDGTKKLGTWDIVIDSRFKASIGDDVDLQGFTFRVVGVLSTGVFGGISPFGKTTYYCFINYKTAQQIFGMNEEVSFIFIKAVNPAVITLVSQRIRERLPDYVVSEMRQREKTSSYITNFQRVLRILSYIPLAICCIICFNTAYSNVIERRREIGVFQSIGAGRLQIFSLFFYESLLTGLVGATIGLILSGLIAYLFLETFSTVLMLSRSGLAGPDLDLSLLGFGMGLASPIVGGMIPAVNASSSKIISNLNPRTGGRPNNLKIAMLAGIGSLLILLGLGVTPQLALHSFEGVDIFSTILVAAGTIIVAATLLGPLSMVLRIFIFPIVKNLSHIPARNVTRSRTKSVLAFSLIAICLSFSVVVQGLQGVTLAAVENTVRRLFTADVVVSSDDGVPLKYLDELGKVGNGEMIESLAPAMFIMQTMYSRGQSSNVWREIEYETRVMTVDPNSFLSMVNVTLIEGNGKTPKDILLGNRNCILTRSLAEKLDVKLGDRLALNIT